MMEGWQIAVLVFAYAVVALQVVCIGVGIWAIATGRDEEWWVRPPESAAQAIERLTQERDQARAWAASWKHAAKVWREGELQYSDPRRDFRRRERMER
jgi:hypothetical protein